MFTALFLAVWFYYFGSVFPLYQIDIADFVKEQKGLSEKPYRTEKNDYLNHLTYKDYVESATRGKLVKVEGAEWNLFFDKIKNAGFSHDLDENKSKNGKSFYFKYNEKPLEQIKPRFNASGDEVYLSLKSDSSFYLRVYYRNYSFDHFLVNTFSEIKIFYPYRKYAFLFAVLGLILYFIFPFRKHEENEIYFGYLGLSLIDIISFLFFLLFFIIPFYVTGSAQTALINPLVLLFWIPSALLVYLILDTSKKASFSLTVENGTFVVNTYKGSITYNISEIESFNAVRIDPPRIISFLSIFGQGWISSSRTHKMNFTDGRELYFDSPGISGKTNMKNIDGIHNILKMGNIKKTKNISIRKLGFLIGSYESEINTLKKNSFIKKDPLSISIIIVLFAALSFGIVEMYVDWFPEILSSKKIVFQNGSRNAVVLADKSFGDLANASEGYNIITGTDNNYFLIGEERYYTGSIMETGILIVKTDQNGNQIFTKTIGQKNGEYKSEYTTINGNNILITGNSGDDLLFVSIGINGDVNFTKTYNIPNLMNRGFNITVTPTGFDLYAFGSSQNGLKYITKIKTDKSGNKISEKIIMLNVDTQFNIEKILKTKAGYYLAGEEKRKTGTSDFNLVKLNETGDIIFRKSYADKGADKLFNAGELGNGDILLIGSGNSQPGNEDLYVVRINYNGNLLWNKYFGTDENEAGMNFIESNNGEVIVIGTSSIDKKLYNRTYILSLDKNGNKYYDSYIGMNANDYSAENPEKEKAGYSGLCIMKLQDSTFIVTGSKDKYSQTFRKEMLFLIFK